MRDVSQEVQRQPPSPDRRSSWADPGRYHHQAQPRCRSTGQRV